jgi:hypothetical protein
VHRCRCLRRWSRLCVITSRRTLSLVSQWDPDDAEDLDGTGAPSHRVEFRISDPETQCDKSKPGHDGRSWMTEMGNQRNYLGRETPLFAPFIYKCTISPRQARDKHRENSKKSGVSLLGLLDFGRMEAEGVLEMGGYEFEYDADVVSFTDLYSTACEPPVVVFFDDQDQVVDTVDPRGLSMTSLVKELAVRGIKSHVRAAPDGGSSGHLQEVWDDRHTKQPPGIRSRCEKRFFSAIITSTL